MEDDASKPRERRVLSKMALPEPLKGSQLPVGFVPWLRTQPMVDNQPEMQRKDPPEWKDPRPLPLSLEDAAVAAVTRLQEDLPAVTMIPEPTAAVEESTGRLQPVEESTGRLQPQ